MKRALRTSLEREASNAKAVYCQAFLGERRVGKTGGHQPLSILEGEHAKRACANSRTKAVRGNPGGTNLVLGVDFLLPCGTEA